MSNSLVKPPDNIKIIVRAMHALICFAFLSVGFVFMRDIFILYIPSEYACLGTRCRFRVDLVDNALFYYSALILIGIFSVFCLICGIWMLKDFISTIFSKKQHDES